MLNWIRLNYSEEWQEQVLYWKEKGTAHSMLRVRLLPLLLLWPVLLLFCSRWWQRGNRGWKRIKAALKGDKEGVWKGCWDSTFLRWLNVSSEREGWNFKWGEHGFKPKRKLGIDTEQVSGDRDLFCTIPCTASHLIPCWHLNPRLEPSRVRLCLVMVIVTE